LKKLKAILTLVLCFTALYLCAQTSPGSVVEKPLFSTFLDGLRIPGVGVELLRGACAARRRRSGEQSEQGRVRQVL